MAAPKYKFMTVGKSKFVHAVRTKAADLRNGGTGSQCQVVRKAWVADRIEAKHKGMSVEAASALDPCPNCDTAGVLKSMETPEQRRARARDKADDVHDRIKDSTKTKGQRDREAKQKAKAAAAAEKPVKVAKSVKARVPAGDRVKANQAAKHASKDEVMMAKVNTYMAYGDEHGWDSEIADGEPGVMVLSTRDNELIRCYFIDGKYDISRHATVEVGAWSGKLRGVHGCRKQMANEGRDRPHPEPGKGRGGPRAKVKDVDVDDESPDDAKRRLPFSLEADDADIFAEILGKRIRWRNGVSGTVEEAVLPMDNHGKKRDKVTLTEHPRTGRRMVNFLVVLDVSGDGEQYGPERSVYLDKIVRVG